MYPHTHTPVCVFQESLVGEVVLQRIPLLSIICGYYTCFSNAVCLRFFIFARILTPIKKIKMINKM